MATSAPSGSPVKLTSPSCSWLWGWAIALGTYSPPVATSCHSLWRNSRRRLAISSISNTWQWPPSIRSALRMSYSQSLYCSLTDELSGCSKLLAFVFSWMLKPSSKASSGSIIWWMLSRSTVSSCLCCWRFSWRSIYSCATLRGSDWASARRSALILSLGSTSAWTPSGKKTRAWVPSFCSVNLASSFLAQNRLTSWIPVVVVLLSPLMLDLAIIPSTSKAWHSKLARHVPLKMPCHSGTPARNWNGRSGSACSWLARSGEIRL